MRTHSVILKKDKETKGTFRYSNVLTYSKSPITSIYLRKEELQDLLDPNEGAPKHLRIQIEGGE